MSGLKERDFEAIFWAAFARGCGGMEFESTCVKKAEILGCYGHVKSNTKKFNDESAFFRNTMACALRAGRIAAGLAATNSRNVISANDFEEAYELVKSSNQKKSPRARGGLCSGG